MDQMIIVPFIVSIFLIPSTLSSVQPLSDEFIELINAQQNSWTAGRNFFEDVGFDYFKRLMGALHNNFSLPGTPRLAGFASEPLPENFDAREKWPECPSIGEIRDQAACGACWAFAAASAMSDRICIASGGDDHTRISAFNLLTCCHSCGHGCHSGHADAAWLYWVDEGLVSGGSYKSQDGCQPSEIKPCNRDNKGKIDCGPEQDTPKCHKTCRKGFKKSYTEDKHYGLTAYTLSNDELQIKEEIFHNGPVEAVFEAYSDFLQYKKGVYKHVSGNLVAMHAVKILGWGIEKEIPYWLVANSWTTDWGDNGFFKILRGKDHCGIESEVTAGKPKMKRIKNHRNHHRHNQLSSFWRWWLGEEYKNYI